MINVVGEMTQAVLNEFIGLWNDGFLARIFGLQISAIGTHKNPNNIIERGMQASIPPGFVSYFKNYGNLSLGMWLVSDRNPDDPWRYGIKDGISDASGNGPQHHTPYFVTDWDMKSKEIYLTGSATVQKGGGSFGVTFLMQRMGTFFTTEPSVAFWTNIPNGSTSSGKTVLATGVFSNAPDPMTVRISPGPRYNTVPPYMVQTACSNATFSVRLAGIFSKFIEKFQPLDNIQKQVCFEYAKRTPNFKFQPVSYIGKYDKTSSPNNNLPSGKGHWIDGQEPIWTTLAGGYQNPGGILWGDSNHIATGDSVVFSHDIRANNADIPYFEDKYDNNRKGFMHVKVIRDVYDSPSAANPSRTRDSIKETDQSSYIKNNQLFYMAWNPYEVDGNDAGKKICEHLWYSPRSGWSGEWSTDLRQDKYSIFRESSDHSQQSCVVPAYHYDNGLHISAALPSALELGGKFDLSFTLNNDVKTTDGKTPTRTRDINLSMYYFILDKNRTDSLDRSEKYNVGAGDVCGGISANTRSGTGCIKMHDGSGVVQLESKGSRTVASNEGDLSHAYAGDQLCVFLWLDGAYKVHYDQNWGGSGYRSAIQCQKIGKRPQMHVMGGDVHSLKNSVVQNAFQGSGHDGNSNKGKLRGSFTQYNVLTNTGGVSWFGSDGRAGGGFGDISLMFANKDNKLGNGGILGELTKISSPSANTHEIKTADGKNYAELRLGDVTESGVYMPTGSSSYIKASGDLGSGKKVTINAPGKTVYISGNIDGKGGPALTQIPMLTINAQNIFIDRSVEKVYANLVAGEAVYTCAELNTAMQPVNVDKNDMGVDEKCKDQLHIYGSITSGAQSSYRRTYGADKGNEDEINRSNTGNPPSAPAEWIDYSPAQWLIPKYISGQNAGGSSVQASAYTTSTTTDLPARL